MNRMYKQFGLEFQAKLLAKERDWTVKFEEQKREFDKKCSEMATEKQRFIDKIQRLQKSHEDMK